MSDDAPPLESVVEMPDEEFREHLGPAIAGVDSEDALGELLVTQPTVFERLTERMATLDDVAAFATEDTETVERYLWILWNGMGLVAENISAVGDAVTIDTVVNWEATDSPIEFHAVTDPDAGSISGGPSLHDDPEITFEGQTDVLFAMLGDDEFNGQLAFIQNRFDVIGPLERSREFDEMMEAVTGEMEALA
ncbi:hypothetical protein [Halorientalis halophila]|uniref:hypothetical protein n=1 Tax=Halorientalis halophila TaxID=3108499 RepID=UPI00300B789C